MKSLILAFALTLPALAAPDWMKEVNIPKKGPLKAMPACELEYSMSWNGRLKAGSFNLVWGEKDPRYPKHFVTHAWGGSTGWAHALFPYQFNYTSFLNPKTRRPIIFAGTEKERKKVDVLNYRFSSRGVSGTETRKTTGKVKKTAFRLPNALDLFSGLLQIRSMPLKKGEKVVMPFHPVSTPYLARIKVLGRETHLGRKCIKLDVGLEKIRSNMELKEYKKLKTATVWLSDDQWRVPIEIRAKVFIGNVRVLLTEHKSL